MVCDVLYLHGFGSPSWGFSAVECPIFQALDRILRETGVRLHAPNYHPGGDVKKTQVHAFLDEIEEQADGLAGKKFAAVVGCSFGGWLASILQDRRPDLFGRAILLAPAIDNYQRNYEGVARECWHMPTGFVEDVHSLPKRPTIRIPTKLLHGLMDNDAGGSAVWRIREWLDQSSHMAAYFPGGVDHSLEPWLSQPELTEAPSLSELLAWSLCPDASPSSDMNIASQLMFYNMCADANGHSDGHSIMVSA
mmetsp:Transcript_2504/g.4620  ORF Transcript_2504/g.4620 Transcript_2504/m.4620 type:complete len:250 (-) Transcript_2504:129-878(-)